MRKRQARERFAPHNASSVEWRGIGSQQFARYEAQASSAGSAGVRRWNLLPCKAGVGSRLQTRFVANALRCSVRRWELTILTSTRCDRLALA